MTSPSSGSTQLAGTGVASSAATPAAGSPAAVLNLYAHTAAQVCYHFWKPLGGRGGACRRYSERGPHAHPPLTPAAGHNPTCALTHPVHETVSCRLSVTRRKRASFARLACGVQTGWERCTLSTPHFWHLGTAWLTPQVQLGATRRASDSTREGFPCTRHLRSCCCCVPASPSSPACIILSPV